MKQTQSFRLENEVSEKIDELAKVQMTTKSNIVEMAVMEYYKNLVIKRFGIDENKSETFYYVFVKFAKDYNIDIFSDEGKKLFDEMTATIVEA